MCRLSWNLGASPSWNPQDLFRPLMWLLYLCLYMYTKVMVKWSRYRPGVAHMVGRGIAILFHDRGTRRGEWSAARSGRTLPRERPGTHFTGGWVGPRSGLDGRKISCPPGFDPGPSSPWLNRYTDWATGPTHTHTLLYVLYLSLIFNGLTLERGYILQNTGV